MIISKPTILSSFRQVLLISIPVTPILLTMQAKMKMELIWPCPLQNTRIYMMNLKWPLIQQDGSPPWLEWGRKTGYRSRSSEDVFIFPSCNNCRNFSLDYYTRKLRYGEHINRPWLCFLNKKTEYFVSAVNCFLIVKCRWLSAAVLTVGIYWGHLYVYLNTHTHTNKKL